MSYPVSRQVLLIHVLALVLPSAMFTQFDEFKVNKNDTNTKFYVRILGLKFILTL